MRSLIFGPMPEGAHPERHVAAGPWCFAGREDIFPGWDDAANPATFFALPPDPFADAGALDAAARGANATARRLALELGAQLNAADDLALSDEFWLLLLGPCFLLTAHVLVERQKRLLDLVDQYGNESLRVPVLPQSDFSFQNSRDLMLHGVLDPLFNHYLYSRLLENLAPEAWTLEPLILPAPLPQATRKSSQKLFGPGLRTLAARFLRDLPFPRYKGFGFAQTGLLSLAALLNSRHKADASLDFSLYCGPEPQWRFDVDALLLACLPRDCLEGIRAKPPRFTRPGPLRGMTAAYMQDDCYRLRLATLRERGYRLFGVQHGANYGNLQSVGTLPFEYSRHAFVTWGWSKHQNLPANALPLPHPLLLRVAGRHCEKRPLLLLVGAEMSTLAYRLKSRPQAGSLPAYRRAKIDFLRTLQDGLPRNEAQGQQSEIAYRPYFAAPGALDDGPHIQRTLPDIALCRGDLTAHMLSCRLLVLDHYGTTLHMALAANTPLIAFWNPKDWVMEEASEEALDALRTAGILFDGPEAAAAQVLAQWPHIRAWWERPVRQKARAFWLERYARITDKAGRPLGMAALTFAWWRCIRSM